jgi:MoaA/NifB/PqqE/SkfB family radical SAM enzyme
MCNIWKENSNNDLSLDEIRNILRDSLFKNITRLILTGGEPFLRPDFNELVTIFVKMLPRLEHIHIDTNALNQTLVLSKTQKLLETLKQKRIALTVQCSLDGLTSVNIIRGIPNASVRIQETLRRLRRLSIKYSNLHVSVACVVQPLNIFEMYDFYKFCLKERLDVTFYVVIIDSDYYQNTEEWRIRVNKDIAKQISKFYEFVVKEAKETGDLLSEFVYSDVLNVLNGKKRKRGCMLGNTWIVLEHDGKIVTCLNCVQYPWGNLRWESASEVWSSKRSNMIRKIVKTTVCPNCNMYCTINPFNFLKFIIKKVINFP